MGTWDKKFTCSSCDLLLGNKVHQGIKMDNNHVKLSCVLSWNYGSKCVLLHQKLTSKLLKILHVGETDLFEVVLPSCTLTNFIGS